MPYNAIAAVASIQQKSGRYGDGQCWTLVEDTVVANGGKSSKSLTPNIGPGVSVIWGKPVAIAALQPGDVLQFSHYDWAQTLNIKIVRSDGSEDEDSKTPGESRGQPQHSAMVIRVVSTGLVDVIEQNIPDMIGEVQVVRLQLMTTATASSVEKSTTPDGKITITTTTTISNKVLNAPKCYRPMDA